MKVSSFFKVMVLAVATLFATGAYAASAVHKGHLSIGDAVQVNGKQLPAGDYTVTWQGEGPNVDLHIAKGRKELATAPAKVAQLDKKATEDAAEISSASGSRQLTGLRFAGQKYQLSVTDSGAPQTGESMK